jgi:hypothetical protein
MLAGLEFVRVAFIHVKLPKDFETHFLKLNRVPHGILGVFNTILYENEFQIPQIFQQTISPFPEQSTLVIFIFCTIRTVEEMPSKTHS